MMELNKYDLVEWVADMILRHDYIICQHCIFECNKNKKKLKDFNMPVCYYNKNRLIKELIKKYNL
jgi:hypothetical protein